MCTTRLVALSITLLATSLAAQPASYSLFGTACNTGRLTPTIGPVPFRAINTPRLGTTFQIETESTANYPFGTRRQVMLLTGFSNTMAGGLPLPFDISVLRPGDPICGMLYTSSQVVTPVPRQSSHLTPSTVDIAVPNTPQLAGLVFFQQVVSIERSSFGPPFSAMQLSQGGRGVIGF